MFSRVIACFVLALAVLCVPVFADPVLGDRISRLHNHPDGGAQPTLYGQRGSGGIFTFDFDHIDGFGRSANLRMSLDLSRGSIRIWGDTFGGLNSGTAFAAPGELVGWWNVDFTYNLSAESLEPSDDVVVVHSGGFGTPNTGVFRREADAKNAVADNHLLVDYAGGNMVNGRPFTYRLGDENDDAGHRLGSHPDWPYDISEWGWPNETIPNEHFAASDWLFAVGNAPVPLPSAAGLGLIGLLVVLRRRRGIKA